MAGRAVTTVETEFRQLRRDLDYFDVDVSTEVLASLLEVSTETVRRTAAKGALAKESRGRFGFLDSVRAYIASLRETAAGRGADEDQALLAKENALLARARREAQEMKNMQARGELLDASAVERQWADDWAKVKASMLTVGSRIGQQMPHLTRTDLLAIDRVIRAELADLATGHERPAGSGAGPLDGAPGAAAEDSAQRLDRE